MWLCLSTVVHVIGVQADGRDRAGIHYNLLAMALTGISVD